MICSASTSGETFSRLVMMSRSGNAFFRASIPFSWPRTQALFSDFVRELSAADLAVLTDIYAAREANPGNVHPEALVSAISARGNDCRYIGPFDEIADFVVENGREGDLILTIGAGTIEKLGKMILEK